MFRKYPNFNSSISNSKEILVQNGFKRRQINHKYIVNVLQYSFHISDRPRRIITAIVANNSIEYIENEEVLWLSFFEHFS